MAQVFWGCVRDKKYHITIGHTYSGILPRSQSEHRTAGINSEEPVHLPGDGIPRGLDGAVSGPER